MSGHDQPEQAVTFKRNGWSRWAGICSYKGQLHWPHGEGVQTATVYFVQREDGLMRVVVAGVEGSMRPLLADCLDPNIKAQVIECKVPLRDVDVSNLTRLYVEEPLAFVGNRHPVHQSRVAALAILLNGNKGEVY
jgi:hypothetical protein